MGDGSYTMSPHVAPEASPRESERPHPRSHECGVASAPKKQRFPYEMSRDYIIMMIIIILYI